MIFTRRDEPEREVLFSSIEDEDELDTRPKPFVRIVAFIVAIALVLLMTDLFVSLLLGR